MHQYTIDNGGKRCQPITNIARHSKNTLKAYL